MTTPKGRGRPKGRTDHPAEVKAAVIAALLAGQGVNEIAREYKLDHSVISHWKASLSPETRTEINQKKGEHLDNLVYDCLTKTLATLSAIAVNAAKDSYIEKQPANELAVLYGVMADKTVRILEAHTTVFAESATTAAPDSA